MPSNATGKKYELIRGELYEVTTAPKANRATIRIAQLTSFPELL
jgi:hypothetical protein